MLTAYAAGLVGIQTADYPMFGRCFWEFCIASSDWEYQLSTVQRTCPSGGREHLIWWQGWNGELARRHANGNAYVRGRAAWRKPGVAVSSMGSLPVALHTGELFDNNVAVVLPHDPAHLPAIWCFCSSPEYAEAVRRIDQKLNVTNATLVKVPFDLERWQKVAAERYPHGLPEPDSDDPTQWLFHGSVARSREPLQVAVARLLGFRWPRQQGQTVSGAGPVPDDGLGAHSDADGVVCLPAVGGEMPAADRLRALLATAYGADWSQASQEALLAQAEYAGKSLEEWLRDGFFAQHARLFHNRPFIWHIWDGAKGGFSALVNYHKLDRRLLERLTYTYLGSWITAQKQADEQGQAGANALHVAALKLQEKLKAILEGEPPYDIYVRWKPLHQQPIGWEPDLNDGVRMNIRPFVTAGILRSKFTINWNKDRGTDPEPNCSGTTERLNDLHFTREEKERARRIAPG